MTGRTIKLLNIAGKKREMGGGGGGGRKKENSELKD